MLYDSTLRMPETNFHVGLNNGLDQCGYDTWRTSSTNKMLWRTSKHHELRWSWKSVKRALCNTYVVQPNKGLHPWLSHPWVTLGVLSGSWGRNKELILIYSNAHPLLLLWNTTTMMMMIHAIHIPNDALPCRSSKVCRNIWLFFLVLHLLLIIFTFWNYVLH